MDPTPLKTALRAYAPQAEDDALGGQWHPAEAAAVVTRLASAPVSADELSRRAVEWGLMRHASVAEAMPLTGQALSRLLLAGYGLPAFAGVGERRSLDDFVDAHLTVLLCLGAEQRRDWSAIHVLSPACDDAVLADWEMAGARLAVAANGWASVPRPGGRFFGGDRDADGTLFWHVADCETDPEGRVLRCYSTRQKTALR